MEKTPLVAYKRNEHRVHLIMYHLVWCPRRRKPVIVGAIAERCQALIEETCGEKGWAVVSLAVQPDHVHLCVQVWPTDSAADIAKECKGVTAHHLRRECAQLLTLPSLWTRSYFASTAGKVSQDNIARYIDAQKGLR